MSSNNTEHLNLHQWEGGDPFSRAEFNENFAALDAAVAGRCRIVVGTYTGNGGSSQTIPLPFRPKAVVVDNANSHGTSCMMAVDGHALRLLSVVDGGFRAQAGSESMGSMTTKGKVYPYFAIG